VKDDHGRTERKQSDRRYKLISESKKTTFSISQLGFSASRRQFGHEAELNAVIPSLFEQAE
jgi:hypothetical protein